MTREELLDQNWKDAEQFCKGAFGHFVTDVSQYVGIVAELLEHATNRALKAPAQAPVTGGKLTFGALVENIAASDRNPIKRGIFIRKTSAKMAEYATKEGCHSTPLDNLRAAPSVSSTEAPAQAVPDGWVLVPRELTAENGAKLALIGDFSEAFDYMDEEGDECTAHIAVSWTTIKEIHKEMVKHFEPSLVSSTDAAPVAWRQVETVADLVNNLRTMDQTLPIYGAFHRDHRAFARSVSVSLEKVIDGEILPAQDAPYSVVIWTGPQPGGAVAGTDCSCGADDGDPLDHHDISCPAALSRPVLSPAEKTGEGQS